jgi:predicted nucleotidyltransferase
VSIDREKLAAFFRANGIVKLSIFGSALREDFRPDSDIDVLAGLKHNRAF